MSSVESLKHWLWKKNLDSKIKSRAPINIPKINPSKKVGILFDATHDSDRKIIYKYSNKLRARGCHVTLLGFIDKKLNHNLFDFLMYHRGSINWYGIPQSPDIVKFLENEVDMLINLDTKNRKHMHYISAISRAKFRIAMALHPEVKYQLVFDSKYKDSLNDVILELEIHLRKLSA